MEPILRKNKRIDNGLNMTVYGGLDYIQGNKKPYFSITAEIKKGINLRAFGCLHEEILKIYPELSDIVALHLSDIDGIPLHAVENGYFWLMAVQGINQYEKSTDKNYLKMFCEYVRISESDGKKLAERIKNKNEFSAWVDTQKSRWKKEADNCIKNLVIYGDYYRPES